MTLTEAQLQARSSGLGGSDMAAVCGENPFKAPISVWLEKRAGLGLPIDMEPPEPFEENERASWGHILEPVLADRYEDDSGLQLFEPLDDDSPVTFRHPDRPWHIGTPDRLCYDPGIGARPMKVLNAQTGYPVEDVGVPVRIWEAKTHGFFGGKAYDLAEMETPDQYRIQCAWYMALTECKQADLSALFDTHLYRVFHIPHDQDVEDALLEEGELFWKRIMDGNPPDPDGSDKFSDYLAQRFKLHTADMVEVSSAEVAEEIEMYKLARAQRKEAEERMAIHKQNLQEVIGASAGLLVDGNPAATWKRKGVGTTSYGKLAEHLRDLHGMTDDEFEEAKALHTGEPSRLFLVK